MTRLMLIVVCLMALFAPQSSHSTALRLSVTNSAPQGGEVFAYVIDIRGRGRTEVDIRLSNLLRVHGLPHEVKPVEVPPGVHSVQRFLWTPVLRAGQTKRLKLRVSGPAGEYLIATVRAKGALRENRIRVMPP